MDEKNVCEYCSKEFSTKLTLSRHQRTTKSCLQLQGKEKSIECENCKKLLAIEYYRQHLQKCNSIFEKSKIEQQVEKNELEKMIEKNDKINKELEYFKKSNLLLEKELEDSAKTKKYVSELEKEIEKLKSIITVLESQNEKLHTSSTSITMKLAEKVNTVTNNTLVIQTNQLTDEVLRQCATTFNLQNACNINGITNHLTTSLQDHVTCTDPSRNIFKYTNENEEEIIDQNLEILIPQYLTAVKDRNNFLYKEVFEYFEKNNVSLDVQTDYRVFYNALNRIIEKTGQQDKYTEKCKQQMVRECKRRFLEKNKNKDKTITKKLTAEDVMINVIETGGSVHDFVDRFFRYTIDDDETDEQFAYRREMEDLFRQKKREYKDEKKDEKIE